MVCKSKNMYKHSIRDRTKYLSNCVARRLQEFYLKKSFRGCVQIDIPQSAAEVATIWNFLVPLSDICHNNCSPRLSLSLKSRVDLKAENSTK